MKIIIYAPQTFENQITTEDVEQAVFDSGFSVTEVLSLEIDVGTMWAEQEGISSSIYPVEWNNLKGCSSPKVNKWGQQYNPQAGSIRNQNLVQNADGMILFWSEEDKQSEYIIKGMKKEGKRVHFQKPAEEFRF